MDSFTYQPSYEQLLAENAALKARLSRASTWVAPKNANEPEPDGHERRFGAFIAMAWADGFWVVAVKLHGVRTPVWIRECKRDERCDSLEQAKAAVEGVMRNLLADAASSFGEAL
jgi:hypothetical protein